MRRRLPIEGMRIQQALEAANRSLQTPLHGIGQHFIDLFNFAQLAVQERRMTKEDLDRLAESALDTLRRLPHQYGERFRFDAALVQAMSRDWSWQSLFSPMLIPCYEETWGHASITPASLVNVDVGERRTHIIDLVLLPLRDELEDVNLLGYPWLAHELGHHLLFRHDGQFNPQMAEQVMQRLRSLRIAAIADRGTARAKSQAMMAEVGDFWHPTPDHRNWSHEIAADIVALYVLGPAYLSAFEDLLEQATTNPFQVAPIHPPYFARVKALLLAARALGWEAYLGPLENIVGRWAGGIWAGERTNRMESLVDSELLSSAVGISLKACEALTLRVCAPSRLTTLSAICSDVQGLEFGTDLLLAAWMVYRRGTPENYSVWEREVVASLVASVTL